MPPEQGTDAPVFEFGVAPRPNVAVNAIIFGADRQTVLLTLRRDRPIWCLPGGMVESGEKVVDALVREVLEEIGASVTVLRLTGVYSEPNLRLVPPARVPVVVLAFECALAAEAALGLSDEVADVAYLPLKQLPEMVKTHAERIQDALGPQSIVVR
jgi:8-oxo-dGTP diphosphatase